MIRCIKKGNLLAVGIVVLFSCSPQSKDVAIKEDITIKAKEDIDFAGVNYVVDKGTVVLTGLAPTPEASQRAEKTVKGIAGVRKVYNTIAIGPVILDEDFPLKQKVDSVLKKYNKAQAQVENGHVVLLGEVSQSDMPKILKSIGQLPVNMVENQLRTE